METFSSLLSILLLLLKRFPQLFVVSIQSLLDFLHVLVEMIKLVIKPPNL